MPNELSLTVGNTTISVPLPRLTNQQILDVLTRYALVSGVYQEGMTPQQLGRVVLKRMLRDVRDKSIDRQRTEFETTRQEADAVALATDNDLFDEDAT